MKSRTLRMALTGSIGCFLLSIPAMRLFFVGVELVTRPFWRSAVVDFARLESVWMGIAIAGIAISLSGLIVMLLIRERPGLQQINGRGPIETVPDSYSRDPSGSSFSNDPSVVATGTMIAAILACASLITYPYGPITLGAMFSALLIRSTIRWINRRDDPRRFSLPPDAPGSAPNSPS